MRVQVIAFGVLKDWMGAQPCTVELPEGATVTVLLEHLRAKLPSTPAASILNSIAVSVNAEYARHGHILSEGDEVGLLPPVSGGSPARKENSLENEGIQHDFTVAFTRDPIEASKIVFTSKSAEDGAVVVFDGIVRNHSRGRRTLYLDYEAYEEMALRQMYELAIKARRQFSTGHIAIVHRLGRIQIGESSVLIVVASAHRNAAFEACRWLIDTLKQTVPIWKRETFADGTVWAPGEPFPADIALHQTEPQHES